MENMKRLQSYYFECPCCKTNQKRLFEYYAKFHGFIKEEEQLEDFRDPYLIERVVIDDADERKTVKIEGEPVYRCGVCFEFIKFDDNVSQPRALTNLEQTGAITKFKPVVVSPDVAIMNSVAYFDKLLNKNGCSVNPEGKIVINSDNGLVYTFDIASALVDAFYSNPNMQVNEHYNWNNRKNSVAQEFQKKIVQTRKSPQPDDFEPDQMLIDA